MKLFLDHCEVDSWLIAIECLNLTHSSSHYDFCYFAVFLAPRCSHSLHVLNDDTCWWYQAPSIFTLRCKAKQEKNYFVNGKFDKFWYANVGWSFKSVPDPISLSTQRIRVSMNIDCKYIYNDDTCTMFLLLLLTFRMNIYFKLKKFAIRRWLVKHSWVKTCWLFDATTARQKKL